MMRVLAAVGLLTAVATTGCSSQYADLEVRIEGAAPDGSVVRHDQVRLEEGVALRVHARPRSASPQEYEEPDAVELRGLDAEILQAFRDAEEDWRWVLVARGAGETCLEVIVEGVVEDCIPAKVTQVPL